MYQPYVPRLTRRATLQWIAASSLALGLPNASLTAMPTRQSPDPAPEGYGLDPNLNHPIVPWQRLMDPRQLAQTALLADLILPASASAPAPSALGVPEFIDEWISAPYSEQLTDRGTVFEGLSWLDGEAGGYGVRGFLELRLSQQTQLLNELARKPSDSPPAGFFRRFRHLVVGAYFTTPEGWKDIGYVGNVPIPSYPPITAQERALLDAALAKLNLFTGIASAVTALSIGDG